MKNLVSDSGSTFFCIANYGELGTSPSPTFRVGVVGPGEPNNYGEFNLVSLSVLASSREHVVPLNVRSLPVGDLVASAGQSFDHRTS